MTRRLYTAFLVIAVAGLLAGCASLSGAPAAATPHFDGVYRLTYGNGGDTLYYRFLADGVVLATRSDAPPSDVAAALESGDYGNLEVNPGKWTIVDGALQVSVTERTVSYDSRFDLRADGAIALRGMQRTFDFLPEGASGGHEISTR
ncbi:MAG: hypothetical protein ACLGHJ_03635 [Gammaproteobacteria bacterium]